MTKIDISSGKITCEVILGVLFVIYLIMGYPTPQPLAQMIHSSLGTFIIVVLFLSLFVLCNPILAILGLFVGFELIRRSEPTPIIMVTSAPTTYYNDESYNDDYNDYNDNTNDNTNDYTNDNTNDNTNGNDDEGFDNNGFNNNSLFDQDKKNSFFTATNQFPYTLEEDVVKVMVPPQNLAARTYQDEYQPILDTIHDAEGI